MNLKKQKIKIEKKMKKVYYKLNTIQNGCEDSSSCTSELIKAEKEKDQYDH